ncbi:COG1470 family protein [Streptomyces sp. H27-D2]|uniref:COG1470 family protein n=1 Tax=Streptomyces sp. H27-D2 TaxID=3046304 RepID=UPI002DBC6E43|nr:hypothetical protein [Streptomyces sp. H27-D2]MEC4017982.1 hypothetical protein [Streptomyces sp. H27-D2]
MTVRAELVVPAETVEPGGSLAADLHVWNEGRIVDAYDLTLLGPPGEWGEKRLGQLPVYPGNHEKIIIPITVPRKIELRPGRVVFAVKVVSAENPTQVAIPEAEIDVGEFRDIEAELTRPQAGGRFSGSNLITLRNTGNTAISLRLRTAPEDSNAPLRSRMRSSRVPLRVGEKARVGVLLRVAAPIPVGKVANWNVDVSIEWGGAEARRTTFVFQQRPLLTKAALKAATVLSAAAIAGVALWMSPIGGGSPQARTETIDGPSQAEQATSAKAKAEAQLAKKEKEEQEKEKKEEKKKEEDKALKRKPLQKSLFVQVKLGSKQAEYKAEKGYRLKLTTVQITATGPAAATLLLSRGSLPLATMSLSQAKDFTPKSPVELKGGEVLRLSVQCPASGGPQSSASPSPGTSPAPSLCTATALVTGELIPKSGPFSKDT